MAEGTQPTPVPPSTTITPTSPSTGTFATTNTGGKGILLKSDTIASQFLTEIKSSLSVIHQRKEKPPRLVGILATSSAPSRNYAEFTRKQCEELGFEFVLKRTGAALTGEEGNGKGGEEGEGVEEAIVEANEDENVDGIMVYFPIFGPQQDHYLQQIVSPLKDVEGLHFKFHYNLYHKYVFPSLFNDGDFNSGLEVYDS
jgi:methylenetetrahydrofolate dehydrogenase (NAD+)